MNVNRSTYYKCFSHAPAARTRENQEISSKILSIYSSTKKRLGVMKIKVLLESIHSIKVSVGRVQRLMKQLNLPKMSTIRPVFKKQIPDNSSPCVNHLEQNFAPQVPNQVWCSDITYVRVGSTFSYLCVVIDLFARKVIAWNLSRKMDACFVIDTVNKALLQRKPTNSILFHSDRGTQYTSHQFRVFLDKNNFVQSFSNKSNPWDNAVVEAFFKFLKHEELHRHYFSSFEQAKLAIFEYIDGFYNPVRPHSFNDFLSPNQKEHLFVQKFSS